MKETKETMNRKSYPDCKNCQFYKRVRQADNTSKWICTYDEETDWSVETNCDDNYDMAIVNFEY